jgi:hypothetical protein
VIRAFYRALFLWRRWRLRREWLQLQRHYGHFSCGGNLAEYIRPEIGARRQRFDHRLADLKEFERRHLGRAA